MKEMVSVDEARFIVLEAAGHRGAEWPEESVQLQEAPGHTLARDVRSTSDYPAFPNSAMDGFAVGSAADSFRIVGESRAGVPFDQMIHPGEAVRISTGAVVPDGAFAVVPIERVTHQTGEALVVDAPPEKSAHFRPPGKDLRRGDLVFAQGTRITASMIPMLAMLGIATVPVYRAPRIAVVSTGDELVDASQPDPLERGKIRDSNGEGLAAMARAIGAVVARVSRARDSLEDLRRVVAEAREADIVLMSGGVSVGPHDHARRVLDDEGFDIAFWRIRQRPGKPLAFATSGRTMLFALPGNPVSSAVCFDQYVRPAVEQLLRQPESQDRWATAVLENSLNTRPALYHFLRGTARFNEDATVTVRETGAQDSNLISSIVQANCLIHVPEGREAPKAGETVRIEWFRY